MRRIKSTAAMSMVLLALTASAATAATKNGTPYGDALYGTASADTMLGYGGADLMYGYGGADTLYGGDESGLGDKILGGNENDLVLGEGGDDALYGDSGNDRVYGGLGDDLVQGGYGYDTLSGGPGADRINAQDGVKDTINVCASVSGDVVYYDRGLDVLQGCVSPQGTGTTLTAEEAIESGKVKLRAEKPPKDLFAHTGKVVVEHEGEELVVAEKELKGHTGHGDHILDPTGRAGVGQEGRR